jgi:FERM central domain./FERM N-terminal domain.
VYIVSTIKIILIRFFIFESFLFILLTYGFSLFNFRYLICLIEIKTFIEREREVFYEKKNKTHKRRTKNEPYIIYSTFKILTVFICFFRNEIMQNLLPVNTVHDIERVGTIFYTKMLEFSILLPNGQTITISLKSKELTGKNLLENVFQSTNIALEDQHYFGLKYSDKNDEACTWLSDADNLKSMGFLSSSSTHPLMQLAVRIFPKCPELSLSTTSARNLFRHHIKNMLTSNTLGCDSRTYAMLDGFIAQCELGDLSNESLRDYSKMLNKLNVFAPSLLGAGTPVSESEYVKMVRFYHQKLKGVRPAQADILFLGMIQKVPLYGFKIYSVSDKINRNYHMALSADGIHFMFQSTIEIFSIPKHKETFAWSHLVFAEQERNKIKIGFFINKKEFKERYIKVSGKYSIKSGAKLLEDINLHKKYFLDQIDGTQSIVYDSRKKAQRIHSSKIPRRNSSFNRTVNSLGRTLRSSLKLNKKKRHASEDIVETGKVNEFELSSVTMNADTEF